MTFPSSFMFRWPPVSYQHSNRPLGVSTQTPLSSAPKDLAGEAAASKTKAIAVGVISSSGHGTYTRFHTESTQPPRVVHPAAPSSSPGGGSMDTRDWLRYFEGNAARVLRPAPEAYTLTAE